MSSVRRSMQLLGTALMGCSCALLSAAAVADAHTLQASDKAKLHYISASGSTLYETGHAAGTLPGSMRVHMRVSATFSGRFTIRAKGGTIRGHGRASPHGSGVRESFAGTLVVTGGSGRYRHAHGRGRMYGVFNRNTYALTINTTGTLHY